MPRIVWFGIGGVVVVIALVVVFVVTGGDESPKANPSASAKQDSPDLAPPTPIPVETVEPGPSPSQAPKAPELGDSTITAAAQEATDGTVTVRLVSLRPITTQAYERGEPSGPGLAVTIQVTNNSGADVSLLADINVYSGAEGRPGVSASLDGHNSPFKSDTLAPGQSAERTAVFATPNTKGTAIAVQVLLGPSTFVINATVPDQLDKDKG